MRVFKLLIVLTLVSFINGCFIVSLSPLYSERELINDESLEGTWGDPESSAETWTITANENRSYLFQIKDPGILFTDESKTDYYIDSSFDKESDALFMAYLLEIDGTRFIDLLPEYPDSLNDLIKTHTVRTHSFYKIEIADSELGIAALDVEWLESKLETEPGFVDIVEVDNILVLTGTTQELQKFVSRYGNVAFEQFKYFQRIR